MDKLRFGFSEFHLSIHVKSIYEIKASDYYKNHLYWLIIVYQYFTIMLPLELFDVNT